MGCKGKGGIG